MMRTLLARKAEATLAQQQIETTAERMDDEIVEENDGKVPEPDTVPSGANGPLTLKQLRRAGSNGKE